MTESSATPAARGTAAQDEVAALDGGRGNQQGVGFVVDRRLDFAFHAGAQIGLDRSQRRDVQHRLTGLCFDIKSNGRFDDETRAVIKRWQAARGYPATGYLNTLQHKALVSEIVSTRVASTDDSDDDSVHHSHHGGGGRRYSRGGPGAFFGHMMMGGLFHR